MIQERPIVLGAISGAPIPIAQVEVLFIEVDPSLIPQVWVIPGLKLSLMVTSLSWLLSLISVMPGRLTHLQLVIVLLCSRFWLFFVIFKVCE